MANIDKISVKNTLYNIISPAVVSDYIEVIGGACTKPDGYEEDEVILAKQNDVQLLFKATQDIAFGANIVENTNCVRTTLEEVLKNAGGGGGASSADQVSYDNSESGLEAENVQEAVDELATKAGTASSQIQTLTNNITDISAEIADMNNVLGAKNILPTTEKTQTLSGVTFTANADGTVTVSGTATNTVYYGVQYQGFKLPNKRLILSGCPSGGSASTYELQVHSTEAEPSQWQMIIDHGDSQSFVADNNRVYACYIGVMQGQTVSNLVFKPMIRLATDESADYEPYSMTNQELTPIAQAVSNRNLIDNPWFTVNQRGVTSWTNYNYYTVDRWVIDAGNASISNGVLSHTGNLYQGLEDERIEPLLGKVVTASILKSDDSIESVTFTMPSSLTDEYVIYGASTSFCVLLRNRNVSQIMRIYGGVAVKAVKLELGSVSTLAMDTAPNYQQELAKCQRYFQRLEQASLGMGFTQIANSVSASIPIPVPMRTTPTISVSGDVGLVATDGTVYHPFTGATAWGENPISVVGCDLTGVTIPANTIGRLFSAASAYIDFSADL